MIKTILPILVCGMLILPLEVESVKCSTCDGWSSCKKIDRCKWICDQCGKIVCPKNTVKLCYGACYSSHSLSYSICYACKKSCTKDWGNTTLSLMVKKSGGKRQHYPSSHGKKVGNKATLPFLIIMYVITTMLCYDACWTMLNKEYLTFNACRKGYTKEYASVNDCTVPKRGIFLIQEL